MDADAPHAAWPDAVKSVLHVGDSSLGYEQGLALELGTRFKAISVRYHAETYTNAALHNFAKARTVELLVRRFRKPDVVLVTLGMNNLTASNPEQYERDVRSIVEQVGDRPCWWKWTEYPFNRPDNGLIAMLARSTAPCRWTSSYRPSSSSVSGTRSIHTARRRGVGGSDLGRDRCATTADQEGA